jgi:large subunit ribosomal protein L21
MYAVIRAGGKQYRVSPGDVVKIEKITAEKNATVEFNDVLAVSVKDRPMGKPASAKVLGQLVDEGRDGKILVFHFKRKKQYKKLRGHRQAYAKVRIQSIEFDGERFAADEPPPATGDQQVGGQQL